MSRAVKFELPLAPHTSSYAVSFFAKGADQNSLQSIRRTISELTQKLPQSRHDMVRLARYDASGTQRVFYPPPAFAFYYLFTAASDRPAALSELVASWPTDKQELVRQAGCLAIMELDMSDSAAMTSICDSMPFLADP